MTLKTKREIVKRFIKGDYIGYLWMHFNLPARRECEDIIRDYINGKFTLGKERKR
jgi:hypothetical protein